MYIACVQPYEMPAPNSALLHLRELTFVGGNEVGGETSSNITAHPL